MQRIGAQWPPTLDDNDRIALRTTLDSTLCRIPDQDRGSMEGNSMVDIISKVLAEIESEPTFNAKDVCSSCNRKNIRPIVF
jgi:hypothetical protein